MKINNFFSSKAFFIFLFSFSLFLIFITIFTEKTFGDNITFEQIILVLSAPAFDLPNILKDTLFRVFYQLSIWFICISFVYALFMKKVKNIKILNYAEAFTISFLCISLFNLNNTYKIMPFIKNVFNSSNFIEENYSVNVDEIQWIKKQNLVLVIAESLENTFYDKDIFDSSIIPNLEKLQKDNIYFENHIQTLGSQWTIAGITSHLFGLPLKLPTFITHGNEYRFHSNAFLPNAISIIKPLEKAGYAVDFFTSWNSTFSTYDKLMISHSRGNNFDKIYYDNLYNKNQDYSDSFILDKAFEHIKIQLQNDLSPFAIIISTYDTHFPAQKDKYIELDNKLLWLVEEIRKLDNENTTIIIVGDHLSWGKEFENLDLTTLENRRIYNLFINPAKEPVLPTSDRIITSVDIAPSILEAIGAELPNNKFGIGTSVFSAEKTLYEKDRALYDKEIPKRSVFYNKLY